MQGKRTKLVVVMNERGEDGATGPGERGRNQGPAAEQEVVPETSSSVSKSAS